MPGQRSLKSPLLPERKLRLAIPSRIRGQENTGIILMPSEKGMPTKEIPLLPSQLAVIVIRDQHS